MSNLYLIPFVLFLIGAWFFYSWKLNRQKAHFEEQRKQFIQSRPDLTDEQKENLKNGEPWSSMTTALLVELFGEPQRKRVLDQSVTRFIWTYSDLFVYIDGDQVIEWKKK